MNHVMRWLIRVLAVLVIMGVPFFAMGGSAWISSGADAVSSATAEAFDRDDVDGRFVIFISDDMRADKESIPVWAQFFKGEDVPMLMDDISCLVAYEDAVALEYASACQSRLPANQMSVRSENGFLLASKVRSGRFDVVIMSADMAGGYGLIPLKSDNNITVVEMP